MAKSQWPDKSSVGREPSSRVRYVQESAAGISQKRRLPMRSERAFMRDGFTPDEASKLVRSHFLLASSRLGRKYRRERRDEVEYYIEELGKSPEEACQLASDLREELISVMRYDLGAMADAFKWSPKYVAKGERIHARRGESLEEAGRRLLAARPAEDVEGLW